MRLWIGAGETTVQGPRCVAMGNTSHGIAITLAMHTTHFTITAVSSLAPPPTQPPPWRRRPPRLPPPGSGSHETMAWRIRPVFDGGGEEEARSVPRQWTTGRKLQDKLCVCCTKNLDSISALLLLLGSLRAYQTPGPGPGPSSPHVSRRGGSSLRHCQVKKGEIR